MDRLNPRPLQELERMRPIPTAYEDGRVQKYPSPLLGIEPWFVVFPDQGAVAVSPQHLLWASQVQTVRSAARRRCWTGTALTTAEGRQLATTRTIWEHRSPRFNFTFMSRTSFTAVAQNQWNTYSFPVSTSYLPCYRMKKKLVYFPYDLPSLWEWSHVVLHDHGVVEFCSESML